MKRSRALALGFFCVGMGIGCTLIHANDDYVGSAAETDSGLSVDAFDSSDALTPVDSSPPDAAVSDTGIGDAALDGDVVSHSFCASRNPVPAFCEEFDINSDQIGKGSKWDSLEFVNGTIILVGSPTVSSPTAARAAVAQGNSGQQALFRKNFTGTFNGFRHIASYRFDVAPTGDIEFLATYISGTNHQVYLFINKTDLSLELRHNIGSTSPVKETFPMSTTISLNQWYSFELDVTLNSSPPVAKVYLNGTLLFTKSLATSLTPGTLSIRDGICYSPFTSGQESLLIDNVAFETH